MGAVEALASDCMDLIDVLGVGLGRGAEAPGSEPVTDAAELGTKPRPDVKDAREDMEWRLSVSDREDLGVKWGSGRRAKSEMSWPTLGRMRGVSVSSTCPEGGH